MQPYKNLSGNSSVKNYESGIDYIIVEFQSGSCRFYKYTHGRTGRNDVEQMKYLAHIGRGLATFIARRKDYADKW
jgi:hypothetical protein